MFLSDKTMKLLLESGLEPDKLVSILQSLREDEAAHAPVKSAGAERTAKWRARKAAEASPRDAAVTVGDVRDAPVTVVTPPSCARVVNTSLPSLRSEEVSNPLRSPSESFPPKSKTEARGCRLPEGWEPEVADKREAVGLLGSPEAARAELDKFRDYWRAVPGAKGRKLDWPATWRNWVRRSAENQPRHGPRSPNVPAPDPKLAAKDANFARALAGADAAVDFLAERRRSGF